MTASTPAAEQPFSIVLDDDETTVAEGRLRDLDAGPTWAKHRVTMRLDEGDTSGHVAGTAVAISLSFDDDVEGHALSLHFPSPEKAEEFRKRLVATGVVAGALVVGVTAAQLSASAADHGHRPRRGAGPGSSASADRPAARGQPASIPAEDLAPAAPKGATVPKLSTVAHRPVDDDQLGDPVAGPRPAAPRQQGGRRAVRPRRASRRPSGIDDRAEVAHTSRREPGLSLPAADRPIGRSVRVRPATGAGSTTSTPTIPASAWPGHRAEDRGTCRVGRSGSGSGAVWPGRAGGVDVGQPLDHPVVEDRVLVDELEDDEPARPLTWTSAGVNADVAGDHRRAASRRGVDRPVGRGDAGDDAERRGGRRRPGRRRRGAGRARPRRLSWPDRRRAGRRAAQAERVRHDADRRERHRAGGHRRVRG